MKNNLIKYAEKLIKAEQKTGATAENVVALAQELIADINSDYDFENVKDAIHYVVCGCMD